MSPHKVEPDGCNGMPDVTIEPKPIYTSRKLRIVCIGAGASGMYMAIRQEQLLKDVEFQIYEKNSGVAGTWFENKYPGAACDVPAHNYTFSFAPKTDWTQYYAGSDEIQEYFEGVAQKYRLHRFIKFGHRVQAARWNDEKQNYELEIATPSGTVLHDRCEVLINAAGLLNAWKWPKIPGLHDFQGKLLHTANFDRQYDLDQKTIALIGNGSSAIQVLPQIQPRAARVDAYVRSPTWISMPFATSKSKQPLGNPKYSDEEKRRFAEDPDFHLQYRCDLEDEFNYYFETFINGGEKQLSMITQLQETMKKSLATRPELAATLIPSFGVGCRRLTPGVGYLESLTQDNVDVITQDITSVTANGLVAADGKERKVDTIICATGFDVSFTPRFVLSGRNGYKCDEKFGADPKGYLTLGIPELPNYFIFYGPQACAANGSFLPVLEATGDYIIRCVQKMQSQDILSMTPKADVVEDLVRHADALMEGTVWKHSCRSWYKNNTTDGRVTAVWPGSTLHYLETLEHPRWEDYDYVYKNKLDRFSYLGNGTTKLELEGKERAFYLRERRNLFDDWWAERVKELDAEVPTTTSA